jgi:two-component system, OmpR family, sensor histidine kinase QseC
VKLSIQARLLLSVLTAVLVISLSTSWLAYQRAVHEVDELVDAQLTQYVLIMLTLSHASDDDDDEVTPPHIHGHQYASRLLFQIWHREQDHDELLARSPDTPGDWPNGIAREGFSEVRLGEHTWRAFAASDDDDEQLAWAALDLDIRDELARDIAIDNLRPYLFGLPLLAVVLWLAIRRGLAPLHQLEAELANRSPARLDALPEDRLPRELAPLVRTMNTLFDRVRRAFDNERRFTSDAAHELRTPLAALRMQMQVAQRTADDTERQSALTKALRGTDRMTHLVAQLLALARLESTEAAGEMAVLDLSDLTAEAVAELESMAATKEIGLLARLDSVPAQAGNPALLRVLIRNLLDNALRYTPAQGRVEVNLLAHAGHTVLRIADNGTGVVTHEREKLGRRFNRFGPKTEEGVGLGLSIVRRIVELHGATLRFGDGLDGVGLSVEVIFPEQTGLNDGLG